MINIARIVLSLLLLYGIYTETGVFTTVAFFLVLLDSEIRYWVTK